MTISNFFQSFHWLIHDEDFAEVFTSGWAFVDFLSTSRFFVWFGIFKSRREYRHTNSRSVKLQFWIRLQDLLLAQMVKKMLLFKWIRRNGIKRPLKPPACSRRSEIDVFERHLTHHKMGTMYNNSELMMMMKGYSQQIKARH